MARPGLVCVVLSAFLGLLSGCATPPTITARHAPFFLEQSHTSQVVASGVAKDGLEHLNIVVTTGTMISCPRGDADLPSSIPCRTNATAQGRTCTFAPGQTTGACSISVDIGPHTLVTYQVQGKSRNGRIVNLPAITYAGGEPLSESFCWFEYIFDLECANNFSPLAPIWWQTGQPAGGAQRPDRIDLGFYQDRDYAADAQTFSNMLEPLIRNVFFNSQQPFAQDYTNSRQWFTLWHGPTGGDRDSCSGSFGFVRDTGAAAAAATTDAEVLIHDEGVDSTDPADYAARGCAQLAHGGGSWVWVNHPVSPNNVVHETGHMLIGLADEYCCDGGYSSISNPRNVFTSLAHCEDVAADIGVSPSICEQIFDPDDDDADDDPQTVNRWRMNDGQPDIMRQSRNTNSDWRNAGDRARFRLLNRCANGDCF